MASTRKRTGRGPSVGARPLARRPANDAERTRTARGDDARARILASTRAQLLTHGPSQFSMRSVAAHARMSLSNLQFHYADVAALLRALLEDELSRGRAAVAAALVSADSVDSLPPALQALLDQQRDQATMRLYLALWSFAGTHPAVADALQAFYRTFVEEVAALLRGRDARLSASDARDRATVAVALLEGASLFRSGVAGELAPRHERLLLTTLLRLLEEDRPDGGRPSRGL